MKFKVNKEEMDRQIAKYALEQGITITKARKEIFGSAPNYFNNTEEMASRIMSRIAKTLDVNAFLSIPEPNEPYKP